MPPTDDSCVEAISGGQRSATVVAPDFGCSSDAATALTSVLWGEREMLDRLLFALTVQQVLLERDALRWLPRASEWATDVATRLRDHEALRAVHSQELARECGLPATASLLDLADSVAEPHGMVLRELHQALTDLTRDVDATVRGNDSLLLDLARPQGSPGPQDEAGLR